MFHARLQQTPWKKVVVCHEIAWQRARNVFEEAGKDVAHIWYLGFRAPVNTYGLHSTKEFSDSVVAWSTHKPNLPKEGDRFAQCGIHSDAYRDAWEQTPPPSNFSMFINYSYFHCRCQQLYTSPLWRAVNINVNIDTRPINGSEKAAPQKATEHI